MVDLVSRGSGTGPSPSSPQWDYVPAISPKHGVIGTHTWQILRIGDEGLSGVHQLARKIIGIVRLVFRHGIVPYALIRSGEQIEIIWLARVLDAEGLRKICGVITRCKARNIRCIRSTDDLRPAAIFHDRNDDVIGNRQSLRTASVLEKEKHHQTDGQTFVSRNVH